MKKKKEKVNASTPPRLATWLLSRASGVALIEDLEGDMYELYQKDFVRLSPRAAACKYWFRVLSVMVSYALRRRRVQASNGIQSFSPLHPNMIAFYFKNGLRYITMNPIYSLINTLGLTLGVTACLVVYLVVRHEISFDSFHAGGDRVYRLVTEVHGPDGEWLGATVPAPLPGALRETVTGIEFITNISRFEPSAQVLRSDGSAKQFPRRSVNGALVDPEYFNILPREWIAGSLSAFHQPFTVVLTESRATTYFESTPVEDVIGKVITYNDSLQATVVGVVKEWRGNTDFAYTDLLSYATVRHSFLKDFVRPDNWIQYQDSFQSLVRLQPGMSPDSMSAKFSATLAARTRTDDPPPVTTSIQLQRLADVHFDKRKEQLPPAARRLYILSVVAGFILASAVFNFINLSTALSTRRSKEIGIRKTIGAARSSVSLQFLSETSLLTIVSIALACLFINPLLSIVGDYIPAGISLRLLTFETIAFLALLILLITLLAGYYPSRVLSSYLPAIVLRKFAYRGNHSHSLRKMLIIFQFSFSLFFITGAIIIRGQLQFIAEKDRGFRTEGVRMFWTNFDDHSNRPQLLLERIRQLPGIEIASLHGGSPMGYATFMNHMTLTGNKQIDVAVVVKSGDENYIPLYGIRMIAGRTLTRSDSLKEFVITATMARSLGFTSPEEALGHSLLFLGKNYPIVGVAEDFHQGSFHDKINPVAIGNWRDIQHAIAVRFDAQHDRAASKKVIEEIAKIFKAFYPDDEFQSHEVEEEIGWMHQDDTQMAKLVDAAMVLTVFISALGVFGLVLFTAETKTKEIAIRKVMGATMTNIALLLSKEFVLLLAIATAFAFPLAWYYFDRWLSSFEYRIEMTVAMYVSAAIAAFLVGLVTVSYHTLRAARANPAGSLRSE